MPGRVNPRQMERMMRKMGLNMEEVQDVKEVVIRTANKEIVITHPTVTVMDVKGDRSYQIQGKVQEKELEPSIPEEDVLLVAEQAGVTKEMALKALEDAGGEPAEAIIKLMGG